MHLLFAAKKAVTLDFGISDIITALVVVMVGFALYAGILKIAKLIAPNLFPVPDSPAMLEILSRVAVLQDAIQGLENETRGEQSKERSAKVYKAIVEVIKPGVETLLGQHKRPDRPGGVEPWYCRHQLQGTEPKDNEVLAALQDLVTSTDKLATRFKELDDSAITTMRQVNKLMDALLKRLGASHD